MPQSKKEQLIHVALALFMKQGIRATGIDTILAESGISKKTLYKHFKSKDELIIAALQARDEALLAHLKDRVVFFAAKQAGPKAFSRILGYFDALDEWFNSKDFSGCTFINASAEYPRPEDPIHVVCENHKKIMVLFIEDLIKDIKLTNATTTAKQISLIVEGAIVTAHTGGDLKSAQLAKKTVEQLLQFQHVVQQ